MEPFQYEKMTIHVHQLPNKCPCDVCKRASHGDGILFLIWENSSWQEHLSLPDALARFKLVHHWIQPLSLALEESSRQTQVLIGALKKLDRAYNSGRLERATAAAKSRSDERPIQTQCPQSSALDPEAVLKSEDERRTQLQRRLARELEKSKSRQNKKRGIMGK